MLHATRTSYLRAVGRGAEQTIGSSLIQYDDGHISSRRIDLRGDRPDPLANALPHEMMHLIVGDLLAGIPTPRWADEGLAILQDPLSKRAGHQAELDTALLADRHIPVAELLNAPDYPPVRDLSVFYGQSASIAAYLAARGTPAQFIAFLRRAIDEGYDQALREHYSIRDLRQLESLWRDAGLRSVRERS